MHDLLVAFAEIAAASLKISPKYQKLSNLRAFDAFAGRISSLLQGRSLSRGFPLIFPGGLKKMPKIGPTHRSAHAYIVDLAIT